MDFSNITSHPKGDEIITKLLSGVSPSEIATWLRIQFPEPGESHLRLSERLLKDFSQSPYLSYQEKFASDLMKINAGEQIDKKVAASILNNKTYQQRLAEHSDEVIDVKRRLIEMDRLFRDRMEQIFDKIQENPGDLGNKGDYKFLKFYEQYHRLIEFYDKSVNNKPDQIIQHNYTLEYIDQTTEVLQDAIRETLEEIGGDAPYIFMNKINEKMASIQIKEAKKTAFPKSFELIAGELEEQ